MEQGDQIDKQASNVPRTTNNKATKTDQQIPDKTSSKPKKTRQIGRHAGTDTKGQNEQLRND